MTCDFFSIIYFVHSLLNLEKKHNERTSADAMIVKTQASNHKLPLHRVYESNSLSSTLNNTAVVLHDNRNSLRNSFDENDDKRKQQPRKDFDHQLTPPKDYHGQTNAIISNSDANAVPRKKLQSSIPDKHTVVVALSKNQTSRFDHMNKQLPLRSGHSMRDDSKETCLSLYEKINNPISSPIPVCASRDFSSHAVHCYQSLIVSPRSSPREAGNGISLRNQRTLNTLANLGVTCTFQNIAINVPNIMRSLRDCTRYCDVRNSKSLFLTQPSKCPLPTISKLMNITEDQDDTRNFVQELIMLNSKEEFDQSKCSQWVNETAFVFIANEPYNIYFQFLTYYNVFVTTRLMDATKRTMFWGLNIKSDKRSRDPLVVRLSGGEDYRFGDFERKLFPRITDLNNLLTKKGVDNNFTCFQSVVKVPWGYSAVPFRCVKDDKMKNETLRCYDASKRDRKLEQVNALNDANSKNAHILLNQRNSLYQSGIRTGRTQSKIISSLMLFRNQVLRACGIKETSRPSSFQSSKLQSPLLEKKSKSLPLNVILIKRKPYLRHEQDAADMFQRVLSNEHELETTLMQNNSRAVLKLKSVYMEELEICEQVMLSHNADIIIGVHGAGLVHTWWMKDGGALLELVPLSKLSRPTYKVLAGLTGIRYYSVTLDDDAQKQHINVSVSAVMETLNKITREITITS